MGYEAFMETGEKLAAGYRNQFPVTSNLIYLNHAAVAPLCLPAADAMKWLADDVCLHGSNHYDKWLDAYEGVRVAAARLIGAERSEIAVVKNTSEGISFVANGIDWRAGDRMVAFREEFPSNYYPWQRLERRGVQVDWLSIHDPLDRIDAAVRGARLLSISWVNYLNGLRVDLNALGDICHRRNCLFFVDAIQGLGAYPIDVRQARIHALSADGHKWMLGPEGCGILYIQQDIQDSIEPVEFGWTNVAGYADYGARDGVLRSDAGRYECGTLNTIGVFGLRAAIEFILDVGISRITPAVEALAQRLYSGAEERGYSAIIPRTADSGSGIVTIQKEGVDSRAAVSHLRSRKIIAAPRQGWIRLSPHFYISTDEIELVVSELP